MENVWRFLVCGETKYEDTKKTIKWSANRVFSAVILTGLAVGGIGRMFAGETEVAYRLSESTALTVTDMSAEMEETDISQKRIRQLAKEWMEKLAKEEITIKETAAESVEQTQTGADELSAEITMERPTEVEKIVSQPVLENPVVPEEQPEKPPVADEIAADEIVADDMTVDEIVTNEIAADDTAQAGEEEKSPGGQNGQTVRDSAFEIDESGMICAFHEEYAEIERGILNLPEQECRGIRSGAFSGCTAEIYELQIPANITEIEHGAFAGLESLEWIETAAENPVYVSSDGVLFNRGRTVLLVFPCGRVGGYLMPESVEQIAKDAFYYTSISILDVRECANIDKSDLENLRALGITVFE